MKRNEAFAPLSRDHHQVLMLSQLLMADAPNYPNLPTETIDKQRYAVDLFDRVIKQHMRLEEQVLFPMCAGLHPEIDQLIYILIDDHCEIENLFQKMQSEVNTAIIMDELAHLLADHMRTEERELFELIQLHAPAELLASIDLEMRKFRA